MYFIIFTFNVVFSFMYEYEMFYNRGHDVRVESSVTLHIKRLYNIIKQKQQHLYKIAHEDC